MDNPEEHIEFLKTFESDCSVGLTKVFVMRGAMITAELDFKINTMEQVVSFIGTGGLEKPSFINKKDWEKNPRPEVQISIFAWSFFSAKKFGYIAFFFQPATNKWNIKSFKLNGNPDPRNFAFKGLEGLLVKGDDNE